jgi:hypothetical protein
MAPSSGSKLMPRKKQAEYLLSFLFDPENGGNT